MDGNVAFEKGDLPLALLCYSKSVIRSPPGEGLAAVLANRSALLLKMKEWELAIEDSKLAISYNYPEDKRLEFFLLMGCPMPHSNLPLFTPKFKFISCLKCLISVGTSSTNA